MKNVHILKTDKPSRLYFDVVRNTFLLQERVNSNPVCFPIETKFIYITNNETIRGGDYYFDGVDFVHRKSIHNSALVEGNKDARKVVLTNDKQLIKDGVQEISEEVLKQFVISPVDYVEVRRVRKEYVDDQDAYGYDVDYYLVSFSQKNIENKENWLEAKALELYPDGCDNTNKSAEVYKRVFIEGYKLAEKEMKERLDKISQSNEDINSFGDGFEHAMNLIYKEL